MLVLGNGDSLRGSASVADKIDYSFHGYAGTTISLLAEGQLPAADGELYPATAIAMVKSMVLVNTHSAAITINLTILKSGSTARRLIPTDLSLGIGYSLYFEGSRFFVITASGEIVTTGETANAVTAAANLTANAIIVGDDGAKGVKKLTLGAADLKLFMNAAGSANEYAIGLYVGSFTRDITTATGTQAVTGVGFKPSTIICFSSTAANGQYSVGFDDLANLAGCFTGVDAANPNFTDGGAYSVYVYVSAGNDYKGKVKSFDADGFTFSWTKTGTPSGNVKTYFLAIR